MAPARRSTRLTGSRTRYTNDPFEAAGISGEDESGSEEAAVRATARGKGKRRVNRGVSSDEEFAANDGDEEEDDDDFEDAEDEEGDGPPLPGMGVVSDEDEEMISDAERKPVADGGEVFVMRSRYNKKRRPDGTIALGPDETHYRGIWNPMEHVGKGVHQRLTFGTDERDLLAMVYARDRWFRGVDSTFPTRASLDEAPTMSNYGCGQTFGADPEEMKREAMRGWDWYYDGGGIGGRFRKRQRVEKIDEKEARRVYLPRPKKGKHTVIFGPADNRKVCGLGQEECLDFGEAWSEVKVSRTKKDAQPFEDTENVPPSSSTADEDMDQKPRKLREGWILNLGNKVQCLAWAPNQGGLTQYLAVVVPITEQQKSEFLTPAEPKGAPAFTPSEPYPAALQIWSFKARKNDAFTRRLDMTFKPKLRLVLCTDWGDLRRLAWCPMARASREEDEEDISKNLGLLAGVWGDGTVKVLDIKLSRDPNATEFYKVHSPAFSAKPPSTVCSCVTWLSPSDIAVGCANGFVAVWNIAAAEKRGTESDPLPYVYHQLHSTYIFSLASAYPTHPHLLGSVSIDGHTRLFSILDPQKDMVETTRMRMGSMHMSYSPFLQSFFSSDENDFVRLLALRRFFTTTTVARLPSTVSTMAPCSFWHPSALMGCTGGTVIAVNPLRRLLYTKERHWQQTWFTHEWAQGKEKESSGVSRFHDGFKAESVSQIRSMMGEKLINGLVIITNYDDGTHITALSWNPNQRCAGWASAGMGCGLVRVEDLAL
ncbi:hypothetical protein VTN00DRAFT_8027 [Thermoascus crustaceus]|uniref:uncharacterized protein n=1 Tax=Thermoascus crustaceus TaxID=5088 RepID=UPI0037444A92